MGIKEKPYYILFSFIISFLVLKNELGKITIF